MSGFFDSLRNSHPIKCGSVFDGQIVRETYYALDESGQSVPHVRLKDGTVRRIDSVERDGVRFTEQRSRAVGQWYDDTKHLLNEAGMLSMNRPIKFRVWDGERMHQIGDGDTPFVITATGGVAEVQVAHPTHVLGPLLKLKERLDCTTLQFTGLHDADGKEVYEGDVVDPGTGDLFRCEWHTEHCAFVFQPLPANQWTERNVSFDNIWSYVSEQNLGADPDAGDLRVIGNIYEHPELVQ